MKTSLLLDFAQRILVKWPWWRGGTSCPETSVTNYQCTLSKIPEMRRSRNNGCSSREPYGTHSHTVPAMCRILTTEHGGTYHKILVFKRSRNISIAAAPSTALVFCACNSQGSSRHPISNADMKSRKHQLLVCADDANLLHNNINTHKTQKTQKHTGTSEEVVSAEKTRIRPTDITETVTSHAKGCQISLTTQSIKQQMNAIKKNT